MARFFLDDRRVLINPGSVGQPRDGDPRAAYAIYDEEKQRVEFHRVAYPVEDTISALREIGSSREWHDMTEVMIQRLREAE
jgi:diadenosine tetraphosphatase ApaH/serine/threonine PP2A family protein phosphatase